MLGHRLKITDGARTGERQGRSIVDEVATAAAEWRRVLRAALGLGFYTGDAHESLYSSANPCVGLKVSGSSRLPIVTSMLSRARSC